MKKETTHAVFLLVVIISIALALFIVLTIVNPKGEKSKEALIKAYLNDITNNNFYAIYQLVPSNYENSEAVRQRIKKYGGSKFANTTIRYVESSSTGVWFALISGEFIDRTGKSLVFKDQLILENANNKWFLLLGKEKSSAPKILDSPIQIQR